MYCNKFIFSYQQKFDLEGDSGIVVRGLGTAMTLVRDEDHHSTPPLASSSTTNPAQQQQQHATLSERE